MEKKSTGKTDTQKNTNNFLNGFKVTLHFPL